MYKVTFWKVVTRRLIFGVKHIIRWFFVYIVKRKNVKEKKYI